MPIADAGGIMPPKSTWFEPKLRDGLLSHVISNRRHDEHCVSGASAMPTVTSHLQFLRRSGGPAAARARRGAARSRGAAWRRHVGDGDQPPLEDVRGHPARARLPTSARSPASPTLQGADAAGRREPPVLDGADEPARRRRDGRLHRHRDVGGQGGQGSEEGRHGERHRLDARPTTTAASPPRPS